MTLFPFKNLKGYIALGLSATLAVGLLLLRVVITGSFLTITNLCLHPQIEAVNS